MTRRDRTLVSLTLFVALGLVGAFVVSAIAGLDEEVGVAEAGGGQDAAIGAAGAGGVAGGTRGTADRPLAPGIDNPATVRIEVLNGAGTAGLARDATHHLRGYGFDVVFFGNAGRFDHGRTVVLDRVGDPVRARAVAAALGVDSVRTVIDSSLMLEVTVVLGDDWPPAPAVEEGWRDRLRGLLRRDSTDAPDGAGAGDGPSADGDRRGDPGSGPGG